MRIYDVIWDKRHNILKVKCDCGTTILHPVNKWTVRCPDCGTTANIEGLRKRYLDDKIKYDD